MPWINLSQCPVAVPRKNGPRSEALLGDPFRPRPTRGRLRRGQQVRDRSPPPSHRLSCPPWLLQALGAEEVASFVKQSNRRDNLLRQLLVGGPQFSRFSDALLEGGTRRTGALIALFSILLERASRETRCQPGIYIPAVKNHCTFLRRADRTANRKSKVTLPALYGAYSLSQISGDIFPG